MHQQSIDYYHKALELSDADENLYCNMARAYFDSNKYAEAVDNLVKVLHMNPKHEVATKFLQWMKSKDLIPSSHIQAVDAALGGQVLP